MLGGVRPELANRLRARVPTTRRSFDVRHGRAPRQADTAPGPPGLATRSPSDGLVTAVPTYLAYQDIWSQDVDATEPSTAKTAILEQLKLVFQTDTRKHGTQHVHLQGRGRQRYTQGHASPLCTGIDVALVEDNPFLWTVSLFNFKQGSDLQNDLEAYAQRHHRAAEIVMKITFPATFPDDPPLFRIERPIFLSFTGVRAPSVAPPALRVNACVTFNV